jgi:predicted Zn-dependent protease
LPLQLSSALLKRLAIVLILIVLVTQQQIDIFPQLVKGSPLFDNSNKKQPQKHFIQICCTWGRKLANGTLTYKIIGGDALAHQAVRNAVNLWNAELKDIRLTETLPNVKADIEVNFNPTAQKIHASVGDMTTSAAGRTLKTAVTAGQSVDNFDENGFITSVRISISRSAFGNTLSLSKIEQLTEHEIGHALGIGHTNFDGDLMSVILSGKSRPISKCDINALLEANQWKIVEHGNAPHAPRLNYINCS